MKKNIIVLCGAICLFLSFSGKGNAQQTDAIPQVSTLIDQYEFAKAVMLADQYLHNDSTNIHLLLLKGRALSSDYQFDESIFVLEKAFGFDSARISPLAELINTCQAAGETEKTIKYGFTAIRFHPDNRRFRIQLAQNLFSIQEYRRSLIVLSPLIVKDSNDIFALKQYGSCYYELNQNDSARYYFQKVLVKSPTDTYSVKKLANVYIRQKRYTEGLKIVDKFLLSDPENISVLKLKGYFHYQLKELATAENAFQKCLQLGDESQFTYKYMGLCFYGEENFLEAESWFGRAFKADTSDAEVLFYRGVSAARSFFPDSGVMYLQKSIDLLMPSKSFLSTIYIELAEAHNVLNNPDTGLQMLFKAMDVNPENKATLFRIAYQYDFRIDDKAKATEYYDLFLKSGYLRQSEIQSGGISMRYEDYARERIEELRK